jgi:hypothetical protein
MTIGRTVGLGSLLGLAALAPSTAIAAQARVTSDVAGTWTGSFAQTEWTFAFTRDGNAWSGQSMSAKAKTWQPLQSVTVVGDSVTFSLSSQPVVTFVLKANPSRTALTGTIEFVGKKLPFSAVRKA